MFARASPRCWADAIPSSGEGEASTQVPLTEGQRCCPPEAPVRPGDDAETIAEDSS